MNTKRICLKLFKTHKKYSEFLDSTLQKTFYLSPNKPSEVQFLINALNLKKTTGPNSIPARLYLMKPSVFPQYLLKKKYSRKLRNCKCNSHH